MIKFNALKINVITEKGNFGLAEEFNSRVNFIASYKNTKGKSTCIEAMYYCLGLEELLGGMNANALRPALRKELEYNDEKYIVLQSEVLLEIENEKGNCVTLKRTAKNQGVSEKLITVYFGKMADAVNGKLKYEDMYIHDAGSATNKKEFHKFLEDFIGWSIPLVPTYDEADRKLYIQMLFPAFFIEQKRGWADILATLPTKFKIKEAPKRVIEFILKLDTLDNEKKREEYNINIQKVKQSWNDTIREIKKTLFNNNCSVYGLPANPQALDINFLEKVLIFKSISENDEVELPVYIERCEAKKKSLNMVEDITIGEKAKP